MKGSTKAAAVAPIVKTAAEITRIPMGRIAVVVATHRYCYPLEKCLRDFADLFVDPRDVIFVDNGSGGEMTAWAAENAPNITTLTREHNGFFCGGYNEGLRHALAHDYEFVMIVNGDTQVHNPNFISEMLIAAERHPRAAFFGPLVYWRDSNVVQDTQLSFPLFSRNLRSFVRHKLLWPPEPNRRKNEGQVEVLNGVCVLCRASALREIGLLDEAMGGYGDEADWAWRAQQLGWHSVFTPIDSIIHHQPLQGYEHYAVKTFMSRRNIIYWHYKIGDRRGAKLYAYIACSLARFRAMKARMRNAPDASKYRYFQRRLQEVAAGLRQGRNIDQWFGPPIGPF